MSWAHVILGGLLLAIMMELVTVGLRFGCGLESRRHTSTIGFVTRGLRVHHGYLGLAVAVLACCYPLGGAGVRNLLLMFAIGMVVSDLIHHFLVLWPITGSPQFDLRYPDTSRASSPDNFP
jgi:hypothetical protein